MFKMALSICGGKRPNRRSLSKFCSPVKSVKGRTIIFLEGGMRNIEKNCLQSLKRQNKLLANTICVKKFVSKTKCL